ncbi:MAG: helix-turn-helix transcriptional regulator [Proteobacteria bacterium]|nr:helix-turn-helix transcriptional regulator [Pseudomonadota bacterium]
MALVRLLRAGQGEAMSPNQLHRPAHEPLGNVSYHMLQLAEAGVIVLERTRQVRGGLEHFYAFRGRWADAVAHTLDALDALDEQAEVAA